MSFRSGHNDDYLPDVLISLFPSLEERAYLDDLVADRRAEVAENFQDSVDAPGSPRGVSWGGPPRGVSARPATLTRPVAGRAHLDDEPGWTFTQKVAVGLLLVLVAWAVLACVGGLVLLLLGALS